MPVGSHPRTWARRVALVTALTAAATGAALTYGAAPALADCFLTTPANITVSNDPNQAGAVVTYPAPTTSGTCGTVTCSPASGSFFPLGTTTVSCTASVGDNNHFTVTVNDTQPPTITAPPNQTVNNSTGQASAIVNYPPPTAFDNAPGVTFSCNRPTGTLFPVGTTIVTCTARDARGNTATANFQVTVKDAEAPLLRLPGDIVSLVGPKATSAPVSYSPSASDNVASGLTLSCSPASGSSFGLGPTTVSCTARDAAGNQTSGSFRVSVIADDVRPLAELAAVKSSGRRIEYALSEAARVELTVERKARGRKVGRRCRKQTRANRRRPVCSLFTRVQKVVQDGAAGRNAAAAKKLKKGSYRVRLVATDRFGNRSKTQSFAFSVRR